MLEILFTSTVGAVAGGSIALLVSRYLREEPLLGHVWPVPLYSAATALAGALVCGALVWRFSWSVTALLFCLFFLVLLASSLIDLATLLLPDALLALAALPAVALFFTGRLAPWPHPLYAALAGGGLLLGLRIAYQLARKKEGLGLGDVKLMALLGFVTDLPGVFDTLFLAAMAGLAVAGFMRIFRGAAPELLPFGPFLCLAAYAKTLWGPYALLS